MARIPTEVRKRPNYPIKVLEKALSIIDFLSREASPVGIAELSNKLKMSASTVHRILDTLRFWGYVDQDSETQAYTLGLKLVELGMAKLHQIDWLEESAPLVKELRDSTGETVHVSILVDGEVFCLMKEESPHTIKMGSYIGKRGPVHCTASGKVLLAHLPHREREDIIRSKGLPRFTATTIVDRDELERELEKVRNQGFAIDRGEHEEEVHCVAAPIRNHLGKVIAALSVSGPSFRIHADDPDPLLVRMVVSTAQRISERLGYNSITRERRSFS